MNKLVAKFQTSLLACRLHERKVAIALSGGPDSMALAALTAYWWRHLIPDRAPERPLALIVDHQLRPESGAEAEQSVVQAAQLGLHARVLKVDWGATGPPEVNKKMTAAREARYSLLFQACRDHGIHNLLMAHHADDQAETFLLRLLHASGIDGLSCMPLMSDKYVASQGVRIIRPLLDIHKEELVWFCDTQGLWYCRDPSNDDVSYQRNKLRQCMRESAVTPTPPIASNAEATPLATSYETSSQLDIQEEEGIKLTVPQISKDALIMQQLCARASNFQQQRSAELLKRCILQTSPDVALMDLPHAFLDVAPNNTTHPLNKRKKLTKKQLQFPDTNNQPWWFIDWYSRIRKISHELHQVPHAIVSLRPFFQCTDQGIAVAALTRLLQHVAGRTYPPSLTDSTRLAERFESGKLIGAFTGGGCIVQPLVKSKGRYALIYPQASQGTVQKTLAEAPWEEKRELTAAREDV